MHLYMYQSNMLMKTVIFRMEITCLKISLHIACCTGIKFSVSKRFLHHGRNYTSRMLLFKYGGSTRYQLPQTKCRAQTVLVNQNFMQATYHGGHSLLPLGLRVFEKLQSIIDQELQAIGCQKISMTTLAPSELWQQTGRWGVNGPPSKELFNLQDRHGKTMVLSPTHEEIVTNIVANYLTLTEKNLPIKLYQITRKFRDEYRPKHGLLRGREFEMKDLYTFDADLGAARNTYELICEAYLKIFKLLELDIIKAEGSTGAIGGDLSHEFLIEDSGVGEDDVLVCSRCGFQGNMELNDSKTKFEKCEESGCAKKIKKCVELGHAFLLGEKYSKPVGAAYSKDGKSTLLQMGCYGLGVSRILQSCVSLGKKESIQWPSLIPPYRVALIPEIEDGSSVYMQKSEEIYDMLNNLTAVRGDILIDDRMKSVGKRRTDNIQIGIPLVVTIKSKVLESSPEVEVTNSSTGQIEFLTLDQLNDLCSSLRTLQNMS